MSCATGTWKFDLAYSQNRSPFLDRIHQAYAFTRGQNDSAIAPLRNGISFAASLVFPLKETKFFYGGTLLLSRFSASHPKPDFIDLNVSRYNFMPLFGTKLFSNHKATLDLLAGPLAGLHVFALKKYGDPLQLEEELNYRPAFFNWGIHFMLSASLQFSRFASYMFIRTECFPVYRVNDYSAALLGSSYPWLNNKGLATSISVGLGISWLQK